MEIVIRQGEPADIPAVFKLIEDLAHFEKAPEAVTNSAERMVLEQPHYGFFVAEYQGEIIGAAVYFFAYFTWVGKSLYLDDLYVKPAFRGKKAGGRLLRRIIELARDEGCQRLRWQVLDWNSHAIEIYQKYGSKISNEWLNCDLDRQAIENF